MTNTSTRFCFMSTNFHIEQFYDRSCNFLSSICHSLDIHNSLVKILDASVPDPSQILSGSFKDMLLFPEEIMLSWKKRVVTKSSDPDRIQTRKFRVLAAFLIDFSPGIAQETQVSWKKRVATKSPDPIRVMTSN